MTLRYTKAMQMCPNPVRLSDAIVCQSHTAKQVCVPLTHTDVVLHACRMTIATHSSMKLLTTAMDHELGARRNVFCSS